MKEDRLKKQTEESEVLSWVKRSRKLEEKKLSEKEKALQLSKIFEEQVSLLHNTESFAVFSFIMTTLMCDCNCDILGFLRTI